MKNASYYRQLAEAARIANEMALSDNAKIVLVGVEDDISRMARLGCLNICVQIFSVQRTDMEQVVRELSRNGFDVTVKYDIEFKSHGVVLNAELTVRL